MLFYAAFNSISVISQQQLTLFMLSWVSPVLGWALKCLAQGHSPRKNPEDPVQLEPRTPGLRVKHFTTEPHRTTGLRVKHFTNEPHRTPGLRVKDFTTEPRRTLQMRFKPGQYSQTVLRNILGLVLEIIVYSEALECNTTSDLLNHMV